MKALRVVALAALCLGTSGCWFGKKALKAPPPPPAATQPAVPQPVAAQPAPPAPAEPEPLPLTQPSLVEKLEPVPVQEPAPQEVPRPRPPVRRNRPPSTPPPPEPAVTPAAPLPAPAPAPQLREIISGDRRRQLDAEYSQGVARANAALKQAATRTLNAAQQQTAARIRTFLAQAGAAQENDISTALQLSRRADLLGQELVKSLK